MANTIQIPFPLPSSGYALNSKMRINLDFLTAQFNEFNTGTATWDTVAIGIPSNETGTLTLWNATTPYYLTIQAGATDHDTTLTLPTGPFINPTSNLMSFDSSGVGSWISASGAFAPTAATYVTMSLNSDLPNERVLTQGSGINISDGGANGNVTISNSGVTHLAATANQTTVDVATGNVTIGTVQDIGTGSSPTFAAITVGNGTSSNPSIAIGDTNTGFYETGGDGNINLILDGTIAVQWTKSDLKLWNSGPVQTPSLILRDTSGSFPTVTINPPTSFTSYTLTMPTTDGNSGEFLQTNGSGVLTWAAATSSGANTALSNLASVAINTTLVSDTDNLNDIGSSSLSWRAGYFGQYLEVDSSQSGFANRLYIRNSSNTASSDADMHLIVGGASGGDAFQLLSVTGVTNWSVGIDNSDSDKYKISNNSTLGTNDYLIIDPTTTGVAIKGTNTNDSASTGFVGELVTAGAAANLNAPPSNQYGDATSVSLTAGDWDVSGMAIWATNGATWTGIDLGISTTSGNSSSGLAVGANELVASWGSTSTVITAMPISIMPYRLSLSSTTTVYLKYRAIYSAGTPRLEGYGIRARRVR